MRVTYRNYDVLCTIEFGKWDKFEDTYIKEAILIDTGEKLNEYTVGDIESSCFFELYEAHLEHHNLNYLPGKVKYE